MARLSFSLFGLLFVVICLFGSGSSAGQQSSRQSPGQMALAQGATSLATISPSSLRKILLPALETLVGAPLRLFRQLVLDIINFLRSHPLSELYDINFLQKLVARMPDRFLAYWTALTEMESQCMSRTVCDLADFTSRRLPKWAEQISLIYLNAFVSVHPFYQVAVNGITTHKCAVIYNECNAEQFLARVRGNLTETFASTVAPLQDAFGGLANATFTTLRSLVVDPDTLERAPVKPNRMNSDHREKDNHEGNFHDLDDAQFERDQSFDHQSMNNPMMVNNRVDGTFNHGRMRAHQPLPMGHFASHTRDQIPRPIQ